MAHYGLFILVTIPVLVGISVAARPSWQRMYNLRVGGATIASPANEELAMKIHLLCPVLVAAVTAVSCGGDDFSSESGASDAAVPDDAVSEPEPDDATPQDAASADVAEPCAIQTTLASCDECINAKCMAECRNCAENDACQEIYACVISTCVGESGVPDQACAQGCVQAHPAGFTAFGAFWIGLSPGCVATKCSAECPW